MGGGSVTTHHETAGGQAVVDGLARHVLVPGLLCGIEGHVNVRHDVEEQVVRLPEAGHVAAGFTVAAGYGAS
ncbi:hypothetical protein J7E83_16900 [Arthrobacter sp. ISL-48]|uniref:hypothetical protein n=1 Tax=Arthrobacter sp. ISL-48 TaxID=2819110 RepID=UPI001BE6D0A4|nr:hypothetical protein [Arthrobacter sp. ISL-48]MBT2533771.1 hypothetical protein [Arthrobacter sp. ISL-48]